MTRFLAEAGRFVFGPSGHFLQCGTLGFYSAMPSLPDFGSAHLI
jgi:hypothetical protein